MADANQLIIESGNAPVPFRYAVGMHGSKFFSALRERRLLGIRCPCCSKVYVPPRGVCGPCFAQMHEWVEVGPGGVIGSFTILRFAFIDPETGVQKPVPYGYGFIKLDGADTLFQHYLDIQDERRIRVGARVEAVFARERHGSMRDIECFRVVP